MSSLDEVSKIVDCCLLNADRLLSAAKDARKPGQTHISYHLATLALEEVGKASMIAVSSLREPRTMGAETNEEEQRPVDWIDDHQRKLFWALYIPTFGKEQITVEQIYGFQDLARGIHEMRLATLYVNPSDPGAQESVSDDDLERLLSLTEARINMEKLTKLRELNQEERDLLEWFFRGVDDPQLKPIIMSGHSHQKLLELKGDAKSWMAWLRESVDESNRISSEFMAKEMARLEPQGAEKIEPKWRMKIRLRSWSHSIRPKPLADWNKKVEGIKLFPTKNKNELLVEFTLPKQVPVEGVWSGGMHVCWLFVASLNIATTGYFWWYLPEFVSRYYEELTDLESQASLLVERNPRLVISWGNLALKEPVLSSVGLIFAHVSRLDQSQREAYGRYYRALSLLAKNDIFLQFERNVIVEFYEAFRSGILSYADWDGSPHTFDGAVDRVFREMMGDSEISTHQKEILHLAGELASGKPSTKQVTLEEVGKMKINCDVYFTIRARREVLARGRQTSTRAPVEDTGTAPAVT
jgi:AbiV family abortive infection protein